MKKIKLGLFIALAFLTAIPNSYSYVTSVTSNMEFGNFMRINKLGTKSFITITPDGTVTHSPDLKKLSGTSSAGIVKYTNLLDAWFSTMQFRAENGTLSNPGAIVRSFVVNPTEKTNILISSINNKQGATIEFSATENIGDITGVYEVISTLNGTDKIDAHVKIHANIIEPPIRAIEKKSLNFGTLIASNTSYNVEIKPNGTVIGGDNMKVNNGTKQARGILEISSKTTEDVTGTAITVKLQQNSITLNSKTGNNTMTVSNLNLVLDSGGDSGTIQNQRSLVYVGGTLNVGANQAPGSYTGSYSIIIDY